LISVLSEALSNTLLPKS